MTLPRVVRDLLMLAPSLRRVPLAPVASARSLPARSTKLILLTCTKRKECYLLCCNPPTVNPKPPIVNPKHPTVNPNIPAVTFILLLTLNMQLLIYTAVNPKPAAVNLYCC